MALREWWDRHGVPRLIKLACGTKPLLKLRSEIIPLAHGDVFEIGCGGGINQRFYDANKVKSYAGIDPGEKLRQYAVEEAQKKGWVADIKDGFGENIPFDDARFDSVVCTFTLCSVQDQAKVLKELHRILKPGGRLLFLEHGHAPDHKIARMQKRIEPIWMPFAGGCHLTRPISEAIAKAGFQVEPMGKKYVSGTPRPLGWVEWGVGLKAA